MHALAQLLPGTLAIMATNLVLLAAFVGIGLPTRHLFGLRSAGPDDVLHAAWVGFGIVAGLLLLWNFVLPVDGRALLVVLAAALAGLWSTRRALAGALAAEKRPGRIVALAMVAAMFWLANHNIGTMRNWDTSLYHLQAEMWAHTYPVVPGLANLHGPLGFNNGILLFDAMLDTGPWAGRPWHVANSVFELLLVLQGLWWLSRPERAESREAAAGIFVFAALALPVAAPLGARAPSLITDAAPTMLMLACLARWYRMLVCAARDAREDAWDVASLVFLSAIAVVLKVNAAIFAATFAPACTIAWLARRPSRDLAWRAGRLAAGAAAVVSIAFLARGVVLSGYPLFPSRVAAAPVSWRVPAEHAQLEYLYAEYSAKASVDDIAVMEGRAGFRAWFPTWARHLGDDPYYVLVPLILASMLVIVAMAGVLRAPPDRRILARRGWLVLLPILVPMAAWFLLAPEPRYAGHLFWGLVGLLSAQIMLLSATSRVRRLAVGILAAVALSPLAVRPLLSWRERPAAGSLLHTALITWVSLPDSGRVFGAPPVTGEHTTFVTRSGLALTVPPIHCVNLPLPCTINPDSSLRLRVPGHLERGFYVDGSWEMEHWPARSRPQVLPALRVSMAHQ